MKTWLRRWFEILVRRHWHVGADTRPHFGSTYQCRVCPAYIDRFGVHAAAWGRQRVIRELADHGPWVWTWKCVKTRGYAAFLYFRWRWL